MAEGNKKPKITLETSVEELVEEHPESVGFLAERGVICITCGEVFWGTLGELMETKLIADPQAVLDELNEHLEKSAKQDDD